MKKQMFKEGTVSLYVVSTLVKKFIKSYVHVHVDLFNTECHI